MTIFEANMDVQAPLPFEQTVGSPDKYQTGIPDTLDLTWLTPDRVDDSDNDGGHEYVAYMYLPDEMPGPPEGYTLKYIIINSAHGGRPDMGVQFRVHYGTQGNEQLQIMSWYPSDETKREWNESTRFITRNIILPPWIMYDAKRKLRAKAEEGYDDI